MRASWLDVTALVLLFHSGWSWILPFTSAPGVWVASPRKLHRRTPRAYPTQSLFSRWTDSIEPTKSDLGLGNYPDVRSALWGLCGEDAAMFEEHHLALLHKAGYRRFAALSRASRAGLDSIGLPAGLVDIIIAGQEGFSPPKHSKGGLVRFAQAPQQQRSCERIQVSDTCDAAYLPEGVNWPGLDSNVLHVRHFFDEFLEKVLCRFDRDKAGFHRWVICGTAGLGKSAFGAWLCAQVVAQNLTLVYQHETMGGWVVIKPPRGGAPARIRGGWGPADGDSVPELFQIKHGLHLRRLHGTFTVFVTSPRESRWHEYRKSVSKMVYLPVYGKEEILDLRQVCFPHLDIAGVEARYGRWGGIPRSVLLKADSDEQEELERKIEALGYERVLLLLDGVEAAMWHDYEVHIKVKGEYPGGAGPDNVTFYELHGWDFGSTYIKDVVFRSISDYERRALRAQIRSGRYIFESQRVAAGHEIELELRRQLTTGGQFTVRRVADGEVDVRTLPPLKEVHFTSGGLSNVFKAGSDELYVSDDPNESAADMIVGRDNMIIQLTLKREHFVVLTASGAAGPVKPSKMKELGALVDGMRLQGHIDLYWAVPDTAFEEYVPEIRYFRLGEEVKAETFKDDPLIRRISHWVLKVHLGPESITVVT